MLLKNLQNSEGNNHEKKRSQNNIGRLHNRWVGEENSEPNMLTYVRKYVQRTDYRPQGIILRLAELFSNGNSSVG